MWNFKILINDIKLWFLGYVVNFKNDKSRWLVLKIYPWIANHVIWFCVIGIPIYYATYSEKFIVTWHYLRKEAFWKIKHKMLSKDPQGGINIVHVSVLLLI